MTDSSRDKWYKEGLNFECQRCGRCCGGEPGFVWVTENDIVNFAERLALPADEVMSRYVRRVWGRWSLKEESNGDCVMLEDKRCKVYDARPAQCVTFPFWRQNLKTKGDWQRLTEVCPGINRGPLVGFREIEDALKKGV